MNNLENAILREIESAYYYRELADDNIETALNTIFLNLAEEEDKHAGILQKKAKNSSFLFEEKDVLSNVKSDYKMIKNNNIKIPILHKQLDAYRLALQYELQSIELYENLLLDNNNERDKKLFEYLIIQEKDHFLILEELINLISRADEWVEAGEFGLREEY